MPKITIVLPLSREWRVEPMREQLETLDTEGLEVDLLVIIDNHEIKLYDWPHDPRILYMDQNHPGESNSYARRQRIADIMNLARTNIDSDYTFILEDDTQIESHYLQTLVSHMSTRKNVGLISGIQAGRWASSMNGIWKTDNIFNPHIWETLPSTPKTLKPVDATGIYCTLTPTKLFQQTPFRCTYQGPDVNYGLDLRTKGYTNYADLNLTCGHVTRTKTIWPTPETGTIKFIRDDTAPGGWKQVETVLT